jgi:hypothetical protein
MTYGETLHPPRLPGAKQRRASGSTTECVGLAA